MKELLAKIGVLYLKQKCSIVSKVYQHVGVLLDELDAQLDGGIMISDILSIETKLDEISIILNYLEGLMIGLDSKEQIRVFERLERDYDDCLELGRYYEWLNPNGQSYKADYGEFSNRLILLPTKEDVLAKIRPEYLKRYLEMEKAGFEPKLQITPIALKISTLAAKIDQKRGLSKAKVKSVTMVDDRISEAELLYAPRNFKVINDGEDLEISGGKNKDEWIKENNGYLIDIIAMKRQVDFIFRSKFDYNLKFSDHAVKESLENMRKLGASGLSCESYLIAQMAALKEGHALDPRELFSGGNSTVLLDTYSKNSDFFVTGFFWPEDSVRLLLTLKAAGPSVGLRFSVRVT
jgi:hypothetical protein